MPASSVAPPFDFSGFFALRTPLLPHDDFSSWSSGLEAARVLEEGGDLDAALSADRARLRSRLREILDRPEVLEALFVASPTLEESLALWREDPATERGLKVERTLVRYFQRMATRCTPFGLFAGTSVGKLGETTALRVAERSGYERHTRLDMDYVSGLTAALHQDPGVKRALTYRPNSSLYQHAGRWRFAESRMVDRARSYHLVSVEPTDYLNATLERAAAGARFETLVQALVDADPEVSAADAEGYVEALVDSQVLVSDLALAVTGPEPIHHLIDQVKGLPTVAETGHTLVWIRDALEDLDRRHLGNPPLRYREIAARLEPLPTPVELPRLFQVDMQKPVVAASLGPAVQRALLEGIQTLHALAKPPAPKPIHRFRDDFRDRYERREIPLVEALDEENGVGFDRSGEIEAEGSPLLEGLILPSRAEDEQLRVGARERLLLTKVLEARATGAQQIELTREEIEAVRDPKMPGLPDAFATMATLGAASPEALAAGDFDLFLDYVAGPSGANLLGRFCQGDPALSREVQGHLRAEEALQADALFAEIVHLPEGRVGNVLSRPLLRAYEIPYLGRPGVSREHQIPVSDLMVSVRGDRVVLRSRRLNREIVPRNSTSHLFRRSLRTYRFLSSLAGQDSWTGSNFEWGPLTGAPFLPRVRVGRLILSPAIWKVREDELARWKAARGTELFRVLQSLRKRLSLPRVVLLRDSDNELPVDFDNVLSLESFASLVRSRSEIILTEQLFSHRAQVVEGPEGRYAHELIVPLVRHPSEGRAPLPAPASVATASPSPSRSFAPGSEWLFHKIYAGTASLDRVIEAIGPVTERALASGDADRFFFVRMGDPHWHLRLRFHGKPERLLESVFPAVTAALEPLRQNNLVWKVATDTYEREVERYGGSEGVQLAEEIFQADSKAILALVGILGGDEAAEARWQMCVVSVDTLLGDLGLDLGRKAALIGRMRASYAREFQGDGALERQLGDRFRSRRKRLESLLDPTTHAADPYAPGLEIWAKRSAELAPVVTRLHEALAKGRLTLPLEELAWPYVHMATNRIFRGAGRAQELVLYDFLGRCYDSLLARQRKNVPRRGP